MPTPVLSADKLSVRGRTGGKHWTAAEVESRQAAQDQASRPGKVRMYAPDWLKENDEAIALWKQIIGKLSGIKLLDNIDSDMLAIYCDALVNYRNCSRRLSMPQHREDDLPPAPIYDLIKATQAWSRIVATYADKLGLTPGGRARLAKKKAERIVDPFADSFGG